MLKHEAQYYNIGPLVRRLTLCEELVDQSPCGDVLFHAYLNPPAHIPTQSMSGTVAEHPAAGES